MPKPISRRSCLSLLSLPLLAGCGGYSTRFQERVAKGVASGANVRKRNRKVDGRLFNVPVDVVDKNQKPTGIQINLPLQFFNGDAPAFKALANEPKSLVKGITAAEQLVTYEMFFKGEMDNEFPAYIIFASFPASLTMQQLEARFSTEWSMGGPAWTDFAGKQWRFFSAYATMATFTNRAGQPESHGVKIHAYATSDAQRHVVIAWYAPERISQAFDFFGTAQVAMYTAAITDPAL